jgi:hypothetical protein
MIFTICVRRWRVMHFPTLVIYLFRYIAYCVCVCA